MHIDSDHGNVRYSCNQCDFKAKWKQSFKEHIDSVRENVQYSCNQCDCKVITKIYMYILFMKMCSTVVISVIAR